MMKQVIAYTILASKMVKNLPRCPICMTNWLCRCFSGKTLASPTYNGGTKVGTL